MRLRSALKVPTTPSAFISDEKLIAVGEIGLDLYPGHPPFDLQQWFFEQQLRLARRYDLAVIVHARRAPDQVFAGLRRFNIKRGIVHAFNGSEQQAHALIGQGMFLGFGGSLTYQGSRRIRRLAQVLPLSSMLLETDAPDIKPSWFASTPERPNEPSQLAAIADCLAKHEPALGLRMGESTCILSLASRLVLYGRLPLGTTANRAACLC
ncbi:MAG: TatD family deoxyribonuclease [Betaproteobacteria bacterium]|nr:TatD family deoxyribonuclease [Betaproteobacteria bacterium]